MIKLKCCDNLELMAKIPDNTIDLIYSDILYGTGRKFKDYQDLKSIRSEIENHYIPRIKEMYRILKDTGSIYLQMDTRINHWIRCLMEDIFGYDNFIDTIIYKYSHGGNSKHFLKRYDTIIFYSKNKDKIVFNKQRGEKYKWINNGISKELNRLNLETNLPYPKEFMDKVNTWKLAKINKLSVHGGYLKNVWELKTLRHNHRLYDTQKPKALIERIIKASSNEGDLVADFYAGSFTTAEVCQNLNRNFIGCDINPKAVEIGKKRLKIVQSQTELNFEN